MYSLEVNGTLDVTVLNGRFGPFAKATLSSEFGVFQVRDAWLKDLGTGTYQGAFDINNIELYNYKSEQFGEVRVAMRAFIGAYSIDQVTTGKMNIEPETDAVDNAETKPTKKPKPQKPKAEPVEQKPRFDAKQLEAEAMLRSCLPEDQIWSIGDRYVIDKSMSRDRIKQCSTALLALMSRMGVLIAYS